MTNQTFKFHIGIDVSKQKLDVAISNNLLQFANNEFGFKELIKQLPTKKCSLIVMEASGGYEQLAANYLRSKKYNVAIVNAKRVRDFAKASGKLAKTDGIDANVIMAFAKAFNPQPQALPTQEERKRVNYLNRRSQLVRLIVREKQHLEKSPKEFRSTIANHLNYMKMELEKIEADLRDQVAEDTQLKDKMQRLEAIQGVGEITAMQVLLEMPEIGTLSPKEVAALSGVAPFNNDSGQKKGKREIRGGRATVRSVLYMATLSAVIHNPIIKRFYDRLISKGKLKKVAIVACMRKLITIMNALMRDGSVWQPNELNIK